MDDNQMNPYSGESGNPYAGTPDAQYQGDVSGVVGDTTYTGSSMDPAGQEPANPYGQPTQAPFGQSTQDPFGQPAQDPYGQPAHDPYGQPAQDPYGQPAQDPYGQPQNQFGGGSSIPNQYGGPVGNNSYGSSNMYPEDGKATGGLICSILSLVFCCFGIILAPIGMVLSKQAINAGNESGKAKAGWIVGIIGLVCNILIILFYVLIIVAGVMSEY